MNLIRLGWCQPFENSCQDADDASFQGGKATRRNMNDWQVHGVNPLSVERS